ncbi:cysteine hydrolase family protein [Pseudomonas typographi]|uniref:Isochorismatase family protein n=1 Tax=Pseudomonas typographi TaxID=2715964 RepID=A0ABR7Z1Z2_9PSED|nr:isochorismatase family protein [Pseudomonas typographi]MBD1551651.1 isochorismatase family protein [Pseudomonas typographi]MBD1587095.1 isochorismatase family protein [Pseudomonas typographi]MBD1599331.1 isochorismatase family protein [Pseudomonas typographi]
MALSALIVIDAQESFRHAPYWSESDLPDYLEKQQALISGCAERAIPVVQIFHLQEQGPFSLASGQVKALNELSISPNVAFHKRYHSALAGTPLAAWLAARGISKLIISGIRTEQCCETTARHASDSGFAVDYVSEATLTFAMVHAGSGRTYSPADIRERTELVLQGRFARIATVAQALEG